MCLATLLAPLLLLSGPTPAPAPIPALQDAPPRYFEVAVVDLDLGDGEVPRYAATPPWELAGRLESMWPRVVLAGEGEAYYAHPGDGSQRFFLTDFAVGSVLARVPGGGDVRGTLFLPAPDLEGMRRLPFTIPAAKAGTGARSAFLLAKTQAYAHLAARDLPGAAWFRHQADEARGMLEPDARDGTVLRDPFGGRTFEGDDTMALFSGGRALSENIQLDRLLPAADQTGEMVDIESIEGITVREMDWAALLEGADPVLDPLASLVPADQHALFFPTFAALTRLADEAEEFGTPVLTAVMGDTRDARTRARYEEQLCLSLDALTRALGGVAVKSVACTGSDPYLRTGSDVALLYQARNAEVLLDSIRGRQQRAQAAAEDVAVVEGTIGTVSYTGVVSPSRRVSSYLAVVGEAVVVTNSLAQLRRIVATAAYPGTSMAALDEYRFFRTRYDIADPAETALLIVPDAAIRRWCGPRWRIATSRRTQVAAALAELQATHLLELGHGDVEPRGLETRPEFPVLGNLHLTADGVRAEKYGTLAFQTPIAELALNRVSKAEAAMYGRWRDGYQQNWSGYFDPIALRFTVRDGEVGIDLSVLPLIGNTDYREMIEVVGDAHLAPGSGDPHAEALFHFVMALDPDSRPLRELGNFVNDFAANLGADPFGWVGGSLAVYFDRDEAWEDLASAEDWEDLQENVLVDPNQFPVVLYVEVRSGLKLAAFLAAFRAMVDGTSPGLLRWETLEHGESKYVRVTSKDLTDELALYYATLPHALLISLHEETLRRAIDRGKGITAPGSGDEAPPTTEPWPGRSVAVDVDAAGLRMLQVVMGDDWSEETRIHSWSNLPVLNEWKRLFPNRDPVEMHLALWGERLVCPAGGTYVWNAEWKTMESTACGHPGQPKPDTGLPRLLHDMTRARAGLTFEHDGLRAVVQLFR